MPNRGKQKRQKERHSLNRYIAARTRIQESRKARLIVATWDDDLSWQGELDDIEKLKQLKEKHRFLWVHIIGLEDEELNRQIGEIFQLQKTALDDVVNLQQRAKFEQYSDQYFVVSHLIEMESTLQTRQISLFIASNFLITIQQGAKDVFTSVRERLTKRQGKTRHFGSDYLSYVVLDAIIDSYFPCLEIYGERLESLEAEVVDNPSRETINDIHHVKRDLLAMRRAIWPLREAISSLIRDAGEIFAAETLTNLRYCYEHTVQIIDFVETYRELGSDMMDVYLSSVSNRMNEVMKVLTIVTTIFVPAGLIASIYGMNFHTDVSPYNMPELNWYLGYPFALAMMLAVSLTTIIVLKCKGWLGDRPTFWRKSANRNEQENKAE